MPTESCEFFEITIERERYGDAPAEDRAALAAHLATCERCRVYAETSERARRGLAARSSGAAVDWSKLEVRLRTENRARVWRTLRLAAFAPLALVLSHWGHRTTDVRDWLDIGIVAAVVAIRIFRDVLRTRQLARVAERTEFLRAYRDEVADRIRKLLVLRWLALAVIATLLALAIGLSTLTLQARLVYLVFAAFAAAVWGQRLIVGLPRLRRELAILDRR